MNRVEFKTKVHDGIIEIPKSNPEIKNKEVNVIILWEEKPLEASKKKKTKPTGEQGSIELQRIYKIIDAGADISSFGDIKEWQRTTRADRNINLNGV